MRFRRAPRVSSFAGKITPLLEAALQLLLVSLLALRLASTAGSAAPEQSVATPILHRPAENLLPPIRIRLLADEKGKLLGIRMNQRPLSDLAELRGVIGQLAAAVAQSGSPGLEIELDSDYRLHYESILEVVAALSEAPAGDGRKLVDKIRFAPPRGP